LTARIAGGARSFDVADVADALGLAVVTGSVGAVGFAGLTLGGGYGPLIGRFGLALDNMIAAEVVLADGRVVFTSSTAEEELFWALRGGGGNFGVVTSMIHRLHDLPTVRSGMLIYPFAEAKAVLERCADMAASMPDEFTVQTVLTAGPDGARVVQIAPTWCGEPTRGEVLLAPFCRLGTLIANTVERKSCGEALATFNGHIVSGRRTFVETCWLPAMDSSSIDVVVAAMMSAPSPSCTVVTQEFKGAASRVAMDATAFPLRRDHVLVHIIASCPDRYSKIEEERHHWWARGTRHAFGAAMIPGGYPDLLADGDTKRARQSYGSNAEWLLRAKRHYDPDNVFCSASPLPFRH
jgi:FAD/FMN-containing dehydrogenase